MLTMIDFDALEKELGPGPMRFSTKGERPLAEQMASLSESERDCFTQLKEKWKKEHPGKLFFSDAMYLRFARCSPGTKKFNMKASYKVMKKFDHRYLTLNASSMESQLLSKASFILCRRMCNVLMMRF
jgi:hypothetical protein